MPKLNTVFDSNNSILQKEDIVKKYYAQDGEKYSQQNSVDENQDVRYNENENQQSVEFSNEYSIGDNGFDIPHNEKRQLDDYVLRKNYSGGKPKKFDCKEIGNNFYIWENNNKTDYTVVNMIEIDGNEDLIV